MDVADFCVTMVLLLNIFPRRNSSAIVSSDICSTGQFCRVSSTTNTSFYTIVDKTWGRPIT